MKFIKIDSTNKAHILDPYAGALCRPHRGLDHPPLEHPHLASRCKRCNHVARVDESFRSAGSPMYLVRLRSRLVSSVVGKSVLDMFGRSPSKILTRKQCNPTATSLKRCALLLACPDELFAGEAIDVYEYPVPVWAWYARSAWASTSWREYEEAYVPPGVELDPTLEQSRAHWDPRVTRSLPGRTLSAPLSELRELIESGTQVATITRRTGIERPTILKYAEQWGLSVTGHQP